MSAAASPAEPPKPSRAGRLLDLVRRLIDYGRELAATLHQRAAADVRAVRRSFGTTDLALILVRIKRGLLRAGALEARLVQNAARLDAPRKPRAAPAQRGPQAARPPVLRPEDYDAPIALPTEAEIAAWVRRRPIGTIIADICRDLGIMPSDPLWRELSQLVIRHGGSLATLVKDVIDRTFQPLSLGSSARPHPAPLSQTAVFADTRPP